jgi:small multidrug resistance pump
VSWVFLFFAITTEVAGTVLMKLSDGLTKLAPTISMFILYGLSFSFLALCLKKIDVSVAYAIWSGLGTALITITGFYLFKEPLGALKVASIVLIIAGVVGLNLSGGGH